ncbi:MAG: hypothetical protein R3F65_15055 [bacterium]
MPRPSPLLLALLLTTACDGDRTPIDAPDAATPADAAPLDAARDATPDAAPDATPTDAAPDAALIGRDTLAIPLLVRLDGAPAPGVRVVQGGTTREQRTGPDGRLVFALDREVTGDLMLVASHPRARQRIAWIIEGERLPMVIELATFDDRDNPAYRFQDPGEPRRRETTAQCGHCHLTLNDAWIRSAHRDAARNPVVHDLYAGTAAAFADPATCAAAGGTWAAGREPGTGEAIDRCFIGPGALPAHNPQCQDGPCQSPPDDFAGCADCHAPAINGALGGRDLLEATGIAFDYGISCDVCHRVEAIVPDAPPGVAGRLRLLRPSEPAPITLGAGGFLPLTFGPSHDSPNPRMGSVQRDHYRDGTLCLGCHQLDTPAADRARWPAGLMPVQSTGEEWRTGRLADAPCQSCHMPPEPMAANAADIQMFPLAEIGLQGGWLRPPGSVRRHAWTGPRTADTLPKLAATLTVRHATADGLTTAEITVQNLGAGHALPTGEPMRQLYVEVDATCEDTPLEAIGGDAIPAWGGAVATRAADDATRWPEARPGDVIRVVRRPGGWHDYDGFGNFARDGFPPEDKGMPIEEVAGSATVIEVIDGLVTLDRPLPEGDLAHLTRDDGLAGRPGFGFARVLVDATGRAMVPHFVAVDTVSDNRLLPGARWTSRHHFAATCATPTVRATLRYRSYPWWLRRERGWTPREIVMAEVVR